MRPRPHFSAFFKLYIFSFAPFQIYPIFRTFALFLAKFDAILVDFLRRQQILNIFRQILADFFSGISQNFNDFGKSDAKILIFL